MQKALKIAIIVRRLNVRGGTQRAAICLARILEKAGHQVTFYTFSYSKEECYPEFLKDFKVVQADKDVVARMMETGGKRGLRAFIENYRNQNKAAQNLAHKIDPTTEILNPHDQLVERVARYFKTDIRDIPSVWVVNDMSTKRISLLRAAQFDASIKPSILKRMAYWCIDQYEYRSFIRYQDIIAVLDKRDKEWADHQFGTRDTRIVRNGLDIKEFPFASHAGILGNKIRLLAVAILLPHRRFEDAINAVAVLRTRGYDAELSIIGDQNDVKYFTSLQAVASKLGLAEQVRFLGKVSYEDLLVAYRAADIFVFPCHLQSWGLAVFEAMASGLPVIVSETSGASEVLKDGETALIVPPYSPDKIAAAAEKLQDQSLYQKLSIDGRAFVEENISWERYAESLLDLFLEAQKKY